MLGRFCAPRSFAAETALVTGASSGIGAAFARALPFSIHLVLTGRNLDVLEALKDELERPGRRIELVTADLTSAGDRARVIEVAERQGVDMLINNAGLGSFGAFLDNEPEREQQAIEVNVLALTLLTRVLLPGMIARARASGRRAALVNVASTAAFTPVPQLAVYAASKAYVLSFGEALAAELRGEPVDLLTVCPGAVRTAFGGRAGYGGGALPGAQDPDQVARRALRSLGRQSIAFTDPLSALTLSHVTRLRALIAQALGQGIGVLRRAQRTG